MILQTGSLESSNLRERQCEPTFLELRLAIRFVLWNFAVTNGELFKAETAFLPSEIFSLSSHTRIHRFRYSLWRLKSICQQNENTHKVLKLGCSLSIDLLLFYGRTKILDIGFFFYPCKIHIYYLLCFIQKTRP